MYIYYWRYFGFIVGNITMLIFFPFLFPPQVVVSQEDLDLQNEINSAISNQNIVVGNGSTVLVGDDQTQNGSTVLVGDDQTQNEILF